MSERLGFILHAKTRPEKSDAFEAFFSGYVEASRAEPGCIEYHMLRDKEDLGWRYALTDSTAKLSSLSISSTAWCTASSS